MGKDFFSKEEDSSVSRFNEAAKKLERINSEQTRINIANINLLGFDTEFNKHNFEIKFNALNSLFAEVSAELTKGKDKKTTGGELKEGRDLRKNIKKVMKENPVFNKQTNDITHAYEIHINEKNWERIEELLFDYELAIKRYLKAHGMSLPESDDPALAAYR